MRLFLFVVLILSLAGCNSIYLKPGTLDTSKLIYTPRGGETMQRSLKQEFDKRGYKIHVGQLKSVKERTYSDSEGYSQPKNIRYSVIIKENGSILRPIWCMFNGFWWWNFSLAISDRQTGTEILSWRGRGCQNSSLRKLEHILDELEMKEPEKPVKHLGTVKKQKQTGLAVLAPQKAEPELLILNKKK